MKTAIPLTGNIDNNHFFPETIYINYKRQVYYVFLNSDTKTNSYSATLGCNWFQKTKNKYHECSFPKKANLWPEESREQKVNEKKGTNKNMIK